MNGASAPPELLRIALPQETFSGRYWGVFKIGEIQAFILFSKESTANTYASIDPVWHVRPVDLSGIVVKE